MIPDDDIVKGLKKLTEKGYKIRDAEKAAGMPVNSLSRNLNAGKIPPKYKEGLFEYLKAKEIEIILGKPKVNTDIFAKSLAALDDFIANVSPEEKERIMKEVKDMKIGGPTFKEFFRDMLGFNVMITHTDENGQQRRVDPMGEEGQKVMNNIPSEPCKTFLQLMAFAKEGNARELVESEMKKNKNLSPGQQDVIRRKIKDGI